MRLLKWIKRLALLAVASACVAAAVLLALANAHSVELSPLVGPPVAVELGYALVAVFCAGGLLGLLVGATGTWLSLMRLKRRLKSAELERDRLKNELFENQNRALKG